MQKNKTEKKKQTPKHRQKERNTQQYLDLEIIQGWFFLKNSLKDKKSGFWFSLYFLNSSGNKGKL